MKRRCILSSFPLLLLLAACAGPPTPIAFEQQGKPLVLRCTLRPKQTYLFASNYLAFPATVKAGSEAKVTMFSTQEADMTITDIPYKMLPITTLFEPKADLFLKKFFVNSKDELGLDKLEPAKKTNIENGVAEIGMTKEQVYTAMGPPYWIDTDIDATNLSYDTILQKDTWKYRVSNILWNPWWPVQKVFRFQDGKLVQTIP